MINFYPPRVGVKIRQPRGKGFVRSSKELKEIPMTKAEYEELEKVLAATPSCSPTAAAIAEQLAAAVIVDDSNADRSTLQVGAVVRLRITYPEGVEDEQFHLGTTGPDCLSVASAIGQAILGAIKGAKIKVNLPLGEEAEVEVVDFHYDT